MHKIVFLGWNGEAWLEPTNPSPQGDFLTGGRHQAPGERAKRLVGVAWVCVLSVCAMGWTCAMRRCQVVA